MFLTILLTTSVLTNAQDKTIQKNFANIKTIQLSTSSGNITITKSTGSGVSVTLKHSYDDDEFTPVIEERNGTLIMKEDFSQGSQSGSSSWELGVPDNTSLNLNTGSGNIIVEGINTNIKSNLGSGDVELKSVKGDLNFNTGSGNIDLTNAEGDLSFNTGSGNIRATGGTGKYSFNAGSGDITIQKLAGAFAVNTGSGDVVAKDLTLQAAGRFNTGSGDAEVNLTANLEHDISINSGSGDATLAFNGTPIQGEVIMTANERNGNIVAPFKFDKEEVIRDNGSSPRMRKTGKIGNKDITIKIGTGSGTAKITK